MYVPPIGLWIMGGVMAARRREEERRERNRRKDIDMGAPSIIRHRRNKVERMCVKAQSDNPCGFALECGHGEPHICRGNDCLEPGHFCARAKDNGPTKGEEQREGEV